MTDAANIGPGLGHAIHAISGKWGRFVTLGVADLILGGIGSALDRRGGHRASRHPASYQS
ncbi:hypothetical protein [Bradyrhizobium sp. Ai1a-2]|uniref:hypothetical protein n=1 Tax=Bradyrhizobium sp. Ai1a-2 TaxID=196490 RepID=UPI000400EB48|nr:hypothetical protein [Bradyrhizobium sp. Ai1a-2]